MRVSTLVGQLKELVAFGGKLCVTFRTGPVDLSPIQRWVEEGVVRMDPEDLLEVRGVIKSRAVEGGAICIVLRDVAPGAFPLVEFGTQFRNHLVRVQHRAA